MYIDLGASESRIFGDQSSFHYQQQFDSSHSGSYYQDYSNVQPAAQYLHPLMHNNSKYYNNILLDFNEKFTIFY